MKPERDEWASTDRLKEDGVRGGRQPHQLLQLCDEGEAASIDRVEDEQCHVAALEVSAMCRPELEQHLL